MDVAIVAAVSGALIGAVVSTCWNLLITGKRQKNALTNEIISDYFKTQFEKLPRLYYLLDNTDSPTFLSDSRESKLV